MGIVVARRLGHHRHLAARGRVRWRSLPRSSRGLTINLVST